MLADSFSQKHGQIRFPLFCYGWVHSFGKYLLSTFNVRMGHLKQVSSNSLHLNTSASSYNSDRMRVSHQQFAKLWCWFSQPTPLASPLLPLPEHLSRSLLNHMLSSACAVTYKARCVPTGATMTEKKKRSLWWGMALWACDMCSCIVPPAQKGAPCLEVNALWSPSWNS